MVSPFQIVAERLGELGVYDFLLPWLITSALMWGLLKKSQIFGEDAIVINSVLSIAISFFLWGSLAIAGRTDVGVSLSKFFTQMVFLGIGFMVILVIGSLFFPDFPKKLTETIPVETMFWIIVVIGIILLVGSGLFNLGSLFYNFLHSFTKVPGGDIGLVLIAVIILLLILMITSGFG